MICLGYAAGFFYYSNTNKGAEWYINAKQLLQVSFCLSHSSIPRVNNGLARQQHLHCAVIFPP